MESGGTSATPSKPRISLRYIRATSLLIPDNPLASKTPPAPPCQGECSVCPSPDKGRLGRVGVEFLPNGQSGLIDIFEDRVSASRRSGYARHGGQSPPYGKSLNSHELCKAQ